MSRRRDGIVTPSMAGITRVRYASSATTDEMSTLAPAARRASARAWANFASSGTGDFVGVVHRGSVYPRPRRRISPARPFRAARLGTARRSPAWGSRPAPTPIPGVAVPMPTVSPSMSGRPRAVVTGDGRHRGGPARRPSVPSPSSHQGLNGQRSPVRRLVLGDTW